PVFLLAAVATTSLAVMLERRGRAALAWLLGLECAVLTGFLLTALIGAPLSDPNAASVTTASLLGLFAMGTQSATVRLLMRDVARPDDTNPPPTERARGAGGWVPAGRRRRPPPADAAVAAAYAAARARFGALFAIMLGFLAGTAVGALAYVATGAWGLLLPLAIMYAILAWARAPPQD